MGNLFSCIGKSYLLKSELSPYGVSPLIFYEWEDEKESVFFCFKDEHSLLTNLSSLGVSLFLVNQLSLCIVS